MQKPDAEEMEKSEKREKPPSWFSESLSRGLLVIRAFEASSPVMRPTDVAKRTGLNRAAARRYLLTLKELGYLGSDDDRFFLQPKILDLGYAYMASMQIDRLVQPFLNKLAARTGELASFAVLHDNEVLFVARASSDKILQIAVSIGGRVPAYATSLGHALLSGLPEDEVERYYKWLQGHLRTRPNLDIRSIKASVACCRKQGWVMVSNLLTTGIAAIAIPVFKASGDLAGAVNIATYGPSNTKQLKRHLPLLRETAASVQRALQSRDSSYPIDRPFMSAGKRRT